MGKEAKVLLVDDDLRNIRILEEMLDEDYEIFNADCGQVALNMVGECNPDIILLDIMMPDIDGLEVCRRLRDDPRYKNTKIILVSGKARLEERLQGYDAGADDYVTKPFDIDEMMAKIAVYAKLKAVEEIDELKTSFLSLISHETGTPLNAIVGLSSLLLSGESLADNDREIVSQIKTAAEGFVEKIQRILLLSRLKRENVEIADTIYSKDLVSTVLARLDNEITENDISVDLSVDDEVELSGNYDLLQKALLYVVENSVGHSPSSSKIEIHQLADAERVVFEIKDCGNGVDKDEMGRIFDPFNLNDIQHHGNGTGISLALSKLILETHGGDLKVHNSDEGGAVFTFSLPLLQKNRLDIQPALCNTR